MIRMAFSNSLMEARAKSIVFVFSIITIFLSFVSFSFLEFVKSDFDTLFNKRTVSVAKLNALKDYISINIADTIAGVDSGELSYKSATDVLSQADYLAKSRWSEYREIMRSKDRDSFSQLFYNLINIYSKPSVQIDFHLDNEEYMENMNAEIVSLDALLHEYLKAQNNGEAIIAKSSHISSRLSQLIDMHLQCAFMEKRQTDMIYSIAFKIITVTFLLGLLATIVSARMIIRSVAVQGSILEGIIAQKTAELLRINEELERRVAQQVADGRKKDSILQSQAKLAAMGEVIANVAHQWRQPLNALTTIIQSFRLRKISGSLDDNFINEQVNSGIQIASRMSNTIQDFRNFFRPEYKPSRFAISQAVKSAIDFFNTCSKDNTVKIVMHMKSDFCIVGYECSFTQVLLNAINNANDAVMASKNLDGWILLKTKRRIINSRNCIVVQIIDNGGGFDMAIVDKVFEPYFTTKHQSVGTGLGLYMSKRIVEDYMGGMIEAKNLRIKDGYLACLNIIFEVSE